MIALASMAGSLILTGVSAGIKLVASMVDLVPDSFVSFVAGCIDGVKKVLGFIGNVSYCGK